MEVSHPSSKIQQSIINHSDGFQLPQGITDPLHIQTAHLPPEFIPSGIKKDESWSVLKGIDLCQFASGGFLDVDSYDVNLTAQFIFQPVHDRLHRCTSNSIG
jgi:hypothetical protein